jgi:hypothetical protein
VIGRHRADGVDAAPPDESPLEVIASALHAAASFSQTSELLTLTEA